MNTSKQNIPCLLLALYITLLGFLSSIAHAEPNKPYPEVVIGGSQIHTLTSKVVGQEYELRISVPNSYENSDISFPVIYLLDAQWDFSMMSSLYGQMFYDGDLPAHIIVGVTWGGENPDPDKLRMRDFSPTQIKEEVGTGGADAFLSFIETELIPYIDENFRTQSQRTLIGSSLGGLFTYYTMFTNPGLFANYLPTATAAGWDDQFIINLAKEFAEQRNTAKGDLPEVSLFSAISKDDGLYESFKTLKQVFENQKPRGVNYKHLILKDLGHSATKSIANLRGLQYFFKPKEIDVSIEELQRLVGRYTGEGDMKNVVFLEDDKLMITNPFLQTNHYVPIENNVFRLPSTPIKVRFSEQDGEQKMQVETPNKIFSFSRE